MEEHGGPGFSLLKNPSPASIPGARERRVLADAKAPHPGPSPRGRGRGRVAFSPLLACPRKREAGVGVVADGGTYKNAGFPIKDVGNDRRDPGGNDRLATLPTPLLAFSRPSFCVIPRPSSVIPRPSFCPFPPLLLSFPAPPSVLSRPSSVIPRPSFWPFPPLLLSFPPLLLSFPPLLLAFPALPSGLSRPSFCHSRSF